MDRDDALMAAAVDPAGDARVALWRSAGGVGRLPVAGGSMRPTLADGEHVRVRAGAPPRRGDVVVAHTADGLIVHRMVGMTGGRVLLRGDDTAHADDPVPAAAVLGRVTAVEGLAGRRLDGPAARAVGWITAWTGRAQYALGDRSLRPRPRAVPDAAGWLAACWAPPLTAEAALVLCAARLTPGDAERARVRDLVAGGVDWERVVDLTRLGQVGPLTYRGLLALGREAAVPESARGALQGQYVGNLLRQREMAAVLAAMLAQLGPAGIPVLAHKGVALALTVYPDPALRVAGDLDLSVPDGDRARAEDLVADIRSALVRANPDRRSQHGHHVELDGAVHHDLDPTRHGLGKWRAGALDWAGIWARAEPVAVGEHTILVPAATDLLLTLIANAVRRGFSPVRLVVDMAALIAGRGGEVDWPALEGELARTRLDRRSWVALGYAVDWCGARVPARLLEPPADLALAAWERELLAAKQRRPFRRLPTRVLWAGSAPAAVRAAWGLWRAGRR